jgi:hypothetical protein
MSGAPVEGKVSAGAQGTAAGMALYGFLLWLLGITVWGVPADAAHAVAAAAAVPAPVIGLLALLPVGLGYLCGYRAKHSPRPVNSSGAAELVAAPVTEGALKGVIDELRSILIRRPLKITLDGKTVATAAVFPTQAGTGPEVPVEGQSMVEPDPTTLPGQ